MMRVVVDDLAFLSADAIVRPATTELAPTTPALRRLEQMGGAEFLRHTRTSIELAVGAAVVTAAGGELPAEFVIHAIILGRDEAVSATGVRRAWHAALAQAREWGFASLTVPPIGIGAGNLTLETAAEILVSEFLEQSGGGTATTPEVTVVVETEAEREVFAGVLHRLTARYS